MPAKKRIAAWRKARDNVLALTGWTRRRWISEAESMLCVAALIFFQARLAERNGPKRFAAAWMTEFESVVGVGMMRLFTHPVKWSFDLRDAFEEAVLHVDPTIGLLRVLVQREFIKGVGPVRRPLTEDDDAAFWKLVREQARILTR